MVLQQKWKQMGPVATQPMEGPARKPDSHSNKMGDSGCKAQSFA